VFARCFLATAGNVGRRQLRALQRAKTSVGRATYQGLQALVYGFRVGQRSASSFGLFEERLIDIEYFPYTANSTFLTEISRLIVWRTHSSACALIFHRAAVSGPRREKAKLHKFSQPARVQATNSFWTSRDLCPPGRHKSCADALRRASSRSAPASTRESRNRGRPPARQV